MIEVDGKNTIIMVMVDKKLETKILECEYSELSQLEYLLTQENINIKSKDFSTNVSLKIELTNEEFKVLKTKLLRNILVSW